MKTTLTIVLLGFITLFHGQSLISDTYWIATKSSQINKNSGIYPLDGTIIHFEEKQVEISHVFYDSIQTYLLKLKNKKIFLQDTLWGEIKHLDNDSLLIDFDKIMRVKFKPLSKNIDFKTKLSFWNFTEWVFSYNDYLQELKLLDTTLDKYPNRNAKLCVTQSQGKRYKYSNSEKWNIKEINRNHIFVKTSGQFNYEIYKVKKYNNDTKSIIVNF